MPDNPNTIDRLTKKEIDPAYIRRAKFVLENVHSGKDSKILEVGCGRGFYLRAIALLHPDFNIYGLDINEEYLTTAKELSQGKRVTVQVGDVTKLPYKDNFFDIIVASEILEHVPNDNQAIAELYRVLKPKGKVIVTVPNQNYPFLWDPVNWLLEKLFHTHLPANNLFVSGIWADHARLYSSQDLENKISVSGFLVKNTSCITNYCFPFSHFIYYGLGKYLVDKGIVKNYTRFSQTENPSVFQKLITIPVKLIDKLNNDHSRFKKQASVNIGLVAIKP